MRTLTDLDGLCWTAEIASHGRTSGYLNPKVHRPILQFRCQDRTMPHRYVSLPRGRDTLEDLSDDEVRMLLEKSKAH